MCIDYLFREAFESELSLKRPEMSQVVLAVKKNEIIMFWMFNHKVKLHNNTFYKLWICCLVSNSFWHTRDHTDTNMETNLMEVAPNL